MKKVLILCCSAVFSVGAHAQGYWSEHFSHNNPGLYTNLNGGTNNLAIENGVALFSGQQGAYYGRTDLTPDTLSAVSMTANLTNAPGGLIGIGWHHPTAGTISAAYDHDASLLMLVEHTGFGFTVLDSVSTGGAPINRIILFPGWIVYADFNGSGPFSLSAPSSVVLDWDSHFMMYGGAGASGVGKIDWVTAGSLPEPGTYLAMGFGLLLLGLRKRLR